MWTLTVGLSLMGPAWPVCRHSFPARFTTCLHSLCTCPSTAPLSAMCPSTYPRVPVPDAFQLPTEAQNLFRIQKDDVLFHCGPLGAYSGLWHRLSLLLLELCLEKNFICWWPLELSLPPSFVGCFGIIFCTSVLSFWWAIGSKGWLKRVLGILSSTGMSLDSDSYFSPPLGREQSAIERAGLWSPSDLGVNTGDKIAPEIGKTKHRLMSEVLSA